METAAVNYSAMTVNELKQVADENNIEYNSKIKKADLINKLEEQL